MSQTESILAIVEPDNHPQELVERAGWLADICGCELSLLLCDPDISPLGEGFFLSNEAHDIREQIRTAQKQIIEDLAESPRERGIQVATDVLEERPIAEGILHRVLEKKPKYVIKGTQYHSVAERSIFVDTDWHLIRSCTAPVWLVKPHAFRDQPVVIAAVDPTHSHDKPAALDQIIVDHAKEIVDPTDGELHLIHTYHRLTGVGAAATRTFKPIELPIDELEKKIRQEHREKLDLLAAENDIDAEHTHQVPGAVREILPTYARSKKADLVVMGALARWGIKRAIIGSTVERVLDHLPCDILVVKPNG